MSKDTITYGSFDPEQDKQILEAANSLKREAKKDGAYFSKKNRPSLSDPSLAPYIGRYKTAYEELLAKQLGRIKPAMQEAKFMRFKEDKAKREEEIDRLIESHEHENHVDRRTLDGSPKPKVRKQNPVLLVLLGIVYLGEWYFNSLAFAFFGGSMLGAYLIGATVTLIEAALAYAAAKNISRFEEGTGKPYLQTALYVGANLGIVIAMSFLRSNISGNSSIDTPAWVFFLVNIAFLFGSIVFSRQLIPSQKEKNIDNAVLEIHSRIEGREAEIKRLNGEKEKLSAQLAEEEKTFLHVMTVAKVTEERIDAHYRETVEIFKTENLATRGDLGTPGCFFEVTPSLTIPKSSQS